MDTRTSILSLTSKYSSLVTQYMHHSVLDHGQLHVSFTILNAVKTSDVGLEDPEERRGVTQLLEVKLSITLTPVTLFNQPHHRLPTIRNNNIALQFTSRVL
ncbi:uncharacterized protein STEHIDRAFT_169226 [Stereum hirsutum FP-91666 SS1]|uniref:uncharacterized protein n=1 Tax=Stereum hirsutum (strain FP-91666) TaxID=721885 RepID=UPI000444928A|nr:uncharacterized protein STEHIDRAFT_169226 [Stereum hirsutum FP-91666 SS1]EIM86320.1 hypothetical protein STEHIDRAFT_169226 [Stereum hirsutum FP-91666 SS1]